MEDITVLRLGIGPSDEGNKQKSPVHHPELSPVRAKDKGKEIVMADAETEKEVTRVVLEKEKGTVLIQEEETEAAVGEERKEQVVIASHSNGDGEEGDGDNRDSGHARRPKIRFTQEQLALLEAVYREHAIPDPVQRQKIAAHLKIKPRQVEVWFQNRRARTKHHQIEEDREELRQWCERLNLENQRLKRELQELRLMRTILPCHHHAPHQNAPMHVVTCLSCKQIPRDHVRRTTFD